MEPCEVLNGAIQHECGGCDEFHACRPGSPGFNTAWRKHSVLQLARIALQDSAAWDVLARQLVSSSDASHAIHKGFEVLVITATHLDMCQGLVFQCSLPIQDEQLRSLRRLLARIGSMAPAHWLAELPEAALLLSSNWLDAVRQLFRSSDIPRFYPKRAMMEEAYAVCDANVNLAHERTKGVDPIRTAPSEQLGRGVKASLEAVAAVRHRHRVATIDDFVPAAVVETLSNGFAQARQRFASFESLSTFAYNLSEPPSHTVEQLIQLYRSYLPHDERAGIVQAEWWVRSRRVRWGDHHVSGHPLHVDHDDNWRHAHNEWRFPDYSVVLYLEADVGGPTVILNATLPKKYHKPSPGREKEEDAWADSMHSFAAETDAAWLVWPKTRRVAWFKGELVHGVLPDRLSTAASFAGRRLHGAEHGMGSGPRGSARVLARTTLMVQLQKYECLSHAASRLCQHSPSAMRGFEESFPLLSHVGNSADLAAGPTWLGGGAFHDQRAAGAAALNGAVMNSYGIE